MFFPYFSQAPFFISFCSFCGNGCKIARYIRKSVSNNTIFKQTFKYFQDILKNLLCFFIISASYARAAHFFAQFIYCKKHHRVIQEDPANIKEFRSFSYTIAHKKDPWSIQGSFDRLFKILGKIEILGYHSHSVVLIGLEILQKIRDVTAIVLIISL